MQTHTQAGAFMHNPKQSAHFSHDSTGLLSNQVPLKQFPTARYFQVHFEFLQEQIQFPPPLLAGTNPLLRYSWVVSATLIAILLLWAGQQTYAKAQQQPGLSLQQQAAWHELMERALRQQLQKEKALMDAGLGWLASIGSTAPFIGLFGTVWGIMHALKDIGVQGNASLDVVARPHRRSLGRDRVGDCRRHSGAALNRT